MKFAQSSIGRRYGWHRPALANAAMRSLFAVYALTPSAPPKLDLLKLQPNPFDQGQRGTCTVNSVNGEARVLHRVLGVPPDADFSRMFGYTKEREDQGDPLTSDPGSSIAESVTVVENYGLALESDWPYDDAHFSLEPTPAIIAEAAQHKILAASMVADNGASFKACIMQQRGVLIGFTVFQSFESQQVAQSGIMPMPKRGEQILGGHAVRIIGYDDTLKANGNTGHYLVRNSWGSGWGQDGNFWMPYAFVHNQKFASDFHRLDKAA